MKLDKNNKQMEEDMKILTRERYHYHRPQILLQKQVLSKIRNTKSEISKNPEKQGIESKNQQKIKIKIIKKKK